MSDVICIFDLRRMFTHAAEQIRHESELLSQLDCVGGDGDHGTTIVRAMEMLEYEMNAKSDRPLDVRLRDAGWSVLGVGGGASSALLGTFIAGMGDVELGRECDCKRLAAGFASGLRAVEKQTKAKPGDKTMMDALVPAVQAIEAAAGSGESIARALKLAADAARSGAEATKKMIARYGRAKFLGERTLGSADAGATSIALLFQGFSTAFAKQKEV
ncbi:MAG TPA: dihydroxyacetone kinase subunit DhaL [Alloacidobacterium sp.]|nr:dihydroxyacetone kinase subunit DhaL [Alloacidobacterium sp.]